MEDRKNTTRHFGEYLQLEGVSVGYQGEAVLRDICLEMKQGEIITLIGPNGAGKSTLLKSIARQLALLGGKVVVDGDDLQHIPAGDLSRRMAVVLTERIKGDLLTCYDVVASGRYPYTGRLGRFTPEDEAQVEAALDAVSAADLGSRAFDAISDGQRQRVLLARAICQEPEIIVLDEPTSFLDIRYKLELLRILRRMSAAQGITVLMSLHEIDLAQKVSDRIICVKDGGIYCHGTPEEIFREETIRQMYDLEHGFYDPLFGSIELSPLEEATQNAEIPVVLVLSSGGSGIPIYRQLGKQGIPFMAGVLQSIDIDYQLARLLATEVITTPAHETLSEAAFARCAACIRDCQRVILTPFPIGEGNRRITELIRLADSLGKLERSWEPEKVTVQQAATPSDRK